MKITITQDMLDKIVFRIRDEVLSSYVAELDVRTDYSGRGMYNMLCIGLVVDSAVNTLIMGMGAVLRDMEEAEELIDSRGDYFAWYDLSIETDDMGRSTIVYFPNLCLAE